MRKLRPRRLGTELHTEERTFMRRPEHGSGMRTFNQLPAAVEGHNELLQLIEFEVPPRIGINSSCAPSKFILFPLCLLNIVLATLQHRVADRTIGELLD